MEKLSIKEFMALVKAGYSEEDIQSYINSQSTEQTETKTEVEVEHKPEASVEPTESSEDMKKLIEQNNQLLQQIKQLQQNNINMARQAGPSEKLTADKVIASFIQSL